MDIRKIRKLIELVEETGVSELEIKEGEESVRIKLKPDHTTATMVSMPMSQPQAAPIPAQPPALTHNPHPPGHGATPPPLPEGFVITAPMVGTFYKSPSPDASPFVTIGQRIEIGDTLCILEAMKMLNQIESEKRGTLTAVLAENGQPIEFGQPLFVIKEE